MRFYGMSLIAGLLSTLALPTAWGGVLLPSMGFLAWFGVIPFYLALKTRVVGTTRRVALTGAETRAGHRPAPTKWSDLVRTTFRYGLLFGIGYYGLGLYFAFHSLHDYAELGVAVSIALAGVFVVILSLLLGLMSLVAVGITRRSKVPLWLSLPLAWVAVEFLRNYFPFGGVPWGNLAYTQRDFHLLLQVLDVTGLYGVLFLLILVNAVLGELYLWLRRRHTFPRCAVITAAALLLVTAGYGFLRLQQIERQMDLAQRMGIALVQANIGQRDKWDTESIDEAIYAHLQLTKSFAEDELDLIIWPESPHPAAVTPEIRRIRKLSGVPAPLLLGILSYEGEKPEEWPPQAEDREAGFTLYNSAVIVSPSGDIFGEYRKQHLVPFGEYVPIDWLLRGVEPIVPVGSNFTAANEARLLSLPIQRSPHLQKLAVLICFEDLFPELSRTMVKQGATLLVNISNDGWYADTSVPYQHVDFSRYRAIENRRAVARATNTGITTFISPTGEMNVIAPMRQAATLVANVPVGGPLTFYTRFGEVFAWTCVGAVIGLMAFALFRRQTP